MEGLLVGLWRDGHVGRLDQGPLTSEPVPTTVVDLLEPVFRREFAPTVFERRASPDPVGAIPDGRTPRYPHGAAPARETWGSWAPPTVPLTATGGGGALPHASPLALPSPRATSDPQRRMQDLRRRVALRAASMIVTDGAPSDAAAEEGTAPHVLVGTGVTTRCDQAAVSGPGGYAGGGDSACRMAEHAVSGAAKRRRLLEHLATGASSSHEQATVEPVGVLPAGTTQTSSRQYEMAPVSTS